MAQRQFLRAPASLNRFTQAPSTIRAGVSSRCIPGSQQRLAATSTSLVSLSSPAQCRAFSISASRSFAITAPKQGLMPDAEDPKPPQPEPTYHVKEPTPLSDEAYHEIADNYLELLVTKLEQVQETREDVDVEFSQGVLSLTFPPNGNYVLNKQPPNKQIWLSSPISGPKRYDWVVAGEDMGSKEGSGVGEWMYLRDGSTLSEVLRQELGVAVVVDEAAP